MKEIAVYTCITGDYDPVSEPLCIENDIDYYLITDFISGNYYADSAYKLLDIMEIVPDNCISPKDKNRYCKMHGYDIFKEYRYSIYVDGSLQIVGKISELLKGIGEYGLAFHSHPYAKDPYMEALSLTIRSRVHIDEAKEVMQKFAFEGLPRHCGSVECGLIACDNKNDAAHKILDNWYKNYMSGAAKRDQLYLPYTLFKMGIDVADIHTFKCNLRENDITRQVCIHTGYQR